MMPLWMMATLPSMLVCGWAFTSLGSPLVAQRVWPMPTVASGIGLRSMSSTRFFKRPAFLRTTTSVFQTFQALQADLQRLAACRFNISRVSNDSTHGSPA